MLVCETPEKFDICVNGKKIEQDHFSAGELKIKLFGCGKERMDIVWHYENDVKR